jgi:hypothetical protein
VWKQGELVFVVTTGDHMPKLAGNPPNIQAQCAEFKPTCGELKECVVGLGSRDAFAISKCGIN